MNASTTSQVDQPAVAGSQDPAETESPAGAKLSPAQPRPPGFRERGRMRRRARFLRKARELAYRDLGGLVFEMQRLHQRNDELVAAKLGVLAAFDSELRTLQDALQERRPVTVLREAGIAACPRCAAIHGSDDRYCPMCGMPRGRPTETPVAATPPTVTGVPAGAAAAGPDAPPSTISRSPGAEAPPLAAASVAAAAAITPGQLALSPAPTPAPAAAGAAPAAARPPAATPEPDAQPTPVPSPESPGRQPTPGAPPAAPAPPAAERPSAVAATPAREEDRPTEIIRPGGDGAA